MRNTKGEKWEDDQDFSKNCFLICVTHRITSEQNQCQPTVVVVAVSMEGACVTQTLNELSTAKPAPVTVS